MKLEQNPLSIGQETLATLDNSSAHPQEEPGDIKPESQLLLPDYSEPVSPYGGKELVKHLPGVQSHEEAYTDMEKMALIYSKCFSVDKYTGEKIYLNPELTSQELRFLYEIDSKIEGSGYKNDPRIKEIIVKRGLVKEDLSGLFECRLDQISTNQEEALSGVIFHYGNLSLFELNSAEGVVFPERVGGNLILYILKSAKGLVLPEYIGGDLHLPGLTSEEGLVFPKNFELKGELYVGSLNSGEKDKLRERYPNIKIAEE